MTSGGPERLLIEQAKGMIAERRNVPSDEAFALIRAYARSNNQHLTDVARSTIDGSLDPSAFAGRDDR